MKIFPGKKQMLGVMLAVILLTGESRSLKAGEFGGFDVDVGEGASFDTPESWESTPESLPKENAGVTENKEPEDKETSEAETMPQERESSEEIIWMDEAETVSTSIPEPLPATEASPAPATSSEPSPTPIPENSPTPIPEPSPTPMPTILPAPTPRPSPTPSPVPSPTLASAPAVSPIPSPTELPAPDVVVKSDRRGTGYPEIRIQGVGEIQVLSLRMNGKECPWYRTGNTWILERKVKKGKNKLEVFLLLEGKRVVLLQKSLQ